ncbi:hypothetical protein IM53_018630 [Xanthomonas phaseoli pv. dieffenbachiae]|uniref:Uncharacterized protein n=1 Tax=Xanthomonas phaseoli pv. dieffenbachiae TaxID=92828 RepID=A0A1V9GWM4_9XANT|nr:hypothetical protein IM53_018630 [Xanthomonas phaseoli pv. dieffenbachiae]
MIDHIFVSLISVNSNIENCGMKTVFNSKRLKVIPSCRSGGGSITFFEMILFFVLVNFLIILEDG